MKTIIPKQAKLVRERIEAKLDEGLIRRLEQYCQYLDSDRDYVLAQALELIFRKDKGFGQWRAAQAAAESAVSPANTGHEPPVSSRRTGI